MKLKLAIVNIQLQASSLKEDKNSVDMFFMHLKGFAEDKNISNVYCKKKRQNIMLWNIMEEVLKETRCIDKSK